MRNYQVFGGALRSDIEFPELRTIESDAPSWTLRSTPLAPDMSSATLLGEAEVIPGCQVRLFRHDDGFRFVFDDTGSFDITDHGREIAWSKGPAAEDEWVRADVTGRVLSVAMHASGTSACTEARSRRAAAPSRFSRRNFTASRRSPSRSRARARGCSPMTCSP